MPIKNLLIAILVLILALGYIKFVILPTEEKTPLVLTEARVTNSKGDFKLIKTEKEWVLEAIKTAPLDPVKVDELIAAISNFEPGEPLPSADLEADLSIYGLKPAELSISAGSAGKKIELNFGKRNEYVGARYLQTGNSQAVYLVQDSIFSLANVEANSFRKVTPISFADRDLESINVSAAKNKFSLVRIAQSWRIQSEDKKEFAASSPAVSEFTRGLRGLTAKNFLEDASDKFGLSKPKLSVSLNFTNNQSTEIVLSAPGDKRYFSILGAPTVYEASEFSAALKEVSIDQFRETSPVKFNEGSLKLAEFSGNGLADVKLSKVNSAWEVNGLQADPVFVAELLKAYNSKLVDAFPAASNKSPSFDKPALRAKFKLADDKDLVLVVGSTLKYAGADHYYAQVEGSGEVFLMSKQTLNKLTPKVDVLRNSKAGGELVDHQQ